MIALLVMSALLGASSFACGIIPLSFSLSKSHLSRLTTIGTGLLLGTALGVIIPEGIETLLLAGLEPEQLSHRVALSLLLGFICMLVVEQLAGGHSHSHVASELPMHAPSSIEFDAELDELEAEQSGAQNRSDASSSSTAAKSKAFPMTLGLVIHSIADGLALGVSFFSGHNEDANTSALSLVVFLAIIVHKAPTSLALTTSLLAASLPRPDCQKHLAVFASTTPIAAIASYAFLSLFGGGQHPYWTGIVLLVSGGTFLYVATVLQPVSEGPQDMGKFTRVGLIAAGMGVPFTLAELLGHGH